MRLARGKKIVHLSKKKLVSNIIGILKYQHADPEDMADAGACFLVDFYGSDIDNETLKEVL